MFRHQFFLYYKTFDLNTWGNELNLQKQTKAMYAKFKKICSLKKNSKAWSEEAIDTLINCFPSHECTTLNVTITDYKDQNRKSLPSEEFDMSV